MSLPACICRVRALIHVDGRAALGAISANADLQRCKADVPGELRASLSSLPSAPLTLSARSAHPILRMHRLLARAPRPPRVPPQHRAPPRRARARARAHRGALLPAVRLRAHALLAARARALPHTHTGTGRGAGELERIRLARAGGARAAGGGRGGRAGVARACGQVASVAVAASQIYAISISISCVCAWQESPLSSRTRSQTNAADAEIRVDARQLWVRQIVSRGDAERARGTAHQWSVRPVPPAVAQPRPYDPSYAASSCCKYAATGCVARRVYWP